jgi:hypothetical protein
MRECVGAALHLEEHGIDPGICTRAGVFPAGRGVILRSHLDLNCRDFITLEAQTHTALPDSQ